MARLVLGIPGSGKSYGARMRVLREAPPTLWLTHLKAERRRIAEWFRRHGVEVIELPPKHESCPLLAKASSAGPPGLLSLALRCSRCSLRATCPYAARVREAVSRLSAGDAVVVVGGLGHAVLAHAARMVVVDEFDTVFPEELRCYTWGEIERAADALEELVPGAGGWLLEHAVEARPGCWLVRGGLPLVPAWSHRGAEMITATVNPEAPLDSAYLVPPGVEARVLPYPDRGDVFYVETGRGIYSSSPLTVGAVKTVARAAARAARRGRTVALVVPSRRLARVAFSAAQSEGLTPVAEGVNWLHPWQYRFSPLRVLVVGGRFHRSLDMDSEVVVALYQHQPPGAEAKLGELYAVSGDEAAWLRAMLEARAHVQTLFRAIRDWRRGHEVWLLDRAWMRALRYYPHVERYVAPRAEQRSGLLEEIAAGALGGGSGAVG